MRARIASLLLLVGCGQAECHVTALLPTPEPCHGQATLLTDNREVRNAVEAFYATAPDTLSLADVTISVVDHIDYPSATPTSNVIGLCNFRTRHISILAELLYAPGLLRQTVFHELGHCAAGVIGHPGKDGDLMNWWTSPIITVEEADEQLENFWMKRRNGQ